MPTSSIEEQSSRYQVSLPDSTDIGNFINETADDFTKSLIVKRSNIPASNSHFNSHKKRENWKTVRACQSFREILVVRILKG